MASILLVEDDIDLRTCLAEVLASDGHEMRLASSGNEAIEALKSGQQVDLIISDHYMRDGSGVDILRYVRERKQSRPKFFLITGQSEMTEENAKELGAQEFILKPFDIPELFSLIDKHLAN